jgi:hypothetical protein
MNGTNEPPIMEPRTLALLLGLLVGLGITVHDIFFVLAGLIALAALATHTALWMSAHALRRKLRHL